MTMSNVRQLIASGDVNGSSLVQEKERLVSLNWNIDSPDFSANNIRQRSKKRKN